MARPVMRWLVFGVLAVAVGLSTYAHADESVSLDAALAAFARLDAQSGRSEVWNCLEDLGRATAMLDDHKPSRKDPQQAVLASLAEHHLSDLVSAYAKLESLRYYLRPLVEDEILRNGGPNLARLEAIRLPGDATEDQAWIYIRDIVRATEGQRRISVNDPQVAMLRALADDHMPLLLQTLDMPTLRYYASAAVRGSADEAHKQLIVDALLQHEELIIVVQRNGWAEDAKHQIVRGLTQGVSYTPRVWVQALAQLKAPETYDTLALQLYRERCSKHDYLVVKDLPGIDLDHAVFASWEEVHISPTHARELREVSQIAVGHGHKGALAYLVSLLPNDGLAHPGRTQEIRETILRHIDFKGSDKAIRDWFDANQESLRFSKTAGRFYVSGGVH